ncbi:U1 small nuclear ribonucleoprotein of 70kDa MW N terminal-domain-containing protein [Lasiosphaeria ovina]|uniref:U1 small nuclear ribonucleoprotein of 70kDa MW N terminal-domain-containing protein n=1 Tax=Lasiosphaeria ovina TaxID=92902 RepID=A0AAE0TT49_9PEZI|nr:U1 small nuclear ribonucleoprotein of 70kDa MW N terminal-domain-containing protein [Lasiosphaeria ovina]
MTDKLPRELLSLFAPRPPLRWVPPIDAAPELRKTTPITGLAQYLPAIAQYEQECEYHPTESWLEKRDRLKLEKERALEKLAKEGPTDYNPHEDPNIRGDAFKTLIVARLDYTADERDLEREFGRFGPIERVSIRIIKDTHADEKGNKKRKPHRGYAFVVFEREKDMRGNAFVTSNLPDPLLLVLAAAYMLRLFLAYGHHGPQACLLSRVNILDDISSSLLSLFYIPSHTLKR